MTRLRVFAVLGLILLLLPTVLFGCGERVDPTVYEREHEHVYGNWYDAAPSAEGAPVTEQVRYCKICRAEETRGKE